jgi:hypothetical protein
MAHATDYQSRRDKPIDMEALVFKQVIRAFVEFPHWSEKALEEYCMSAYKRMGITAAIFKRAKEWASTNLKLRKS